MTALFYSYILTDKKLALKLVDFRHFKMELHQKIIEFVAKNKFVLLEPEKASNFRDFLDSNNMESVHEHMVCEEFVKRILPHVFELPLDPATRRAMELMEFNSNYTRTDQGFVLKPSEESVDSAINKLDWKNLISFVKKNATNKGDFVEPDNASHTLLYPSNEPSPVSKDAIGLHGEYIDLLSGALGKDFELARGVHLTTEEIRKRLCEEKQIFEKKSILSNNLNSFNNFMKLLNLTKDMYEMSVNMRNQLISERIE